MASVCSVLCQRSGCKDNSYERQDIEKCNTFSNMSMEQEHPPSVPPPSSSQTGKKLKERVHSCPPRRATVNEELRYLVKKHYPRLSYQQVVYDRNSFLFNIQKHFTVSKMSQKFCKTEMVNLLLLWTESAINSILLWNRNRKN